MLRYVALGPSFSDFPRSPAEGPTLGARDSDELLFFQSQLLLLFGLEVGQGTCELVLLCSVERQ